MCIKSFIRHGHHFILYTYKKFNNIPSECEVRDANEFIPEELVFKDYHNKYSTFANILRLKIAYQTGYMYVDMDIVCINNIIPSDDWYFITDLKTPTVVTNCCFKCPKECDFLNDIICYVNNPLKIYPTIDSKSRIRSKLLTRFNTTKNHNDISLWGSIEWASILKVMKPFIKKHNLLKYIHPRDELFLFHYDNTIKYIDDNIHLADVDISNRWGLHIYNGSKEILDNKNNLEHGIIKDLIDIYN